LLSRAWPGLAARLGAVAEVSAADYGHLALTGHSIHLDESNLRHLRSARKPFKASAVRLARAYSDVRHSLL